MIKAFGNAQGFPVDISTSIAADFGALTDALDQPGIDLQSELHALRRDVRTAISSFLGLTMTIIADGMPFSFTVLEPLAAEEPAQASLCLRWPLQSARDDDGGSHLILFASRAGAFVDLSADLAYALGIDLSILRVDEHREMPDPRAASGLAETATVNQAIGVLISRGNTPEQAHDHLHGAGSHSAAAAAQHVIDSLTPAPAEPARPPTAEESRRHG